MKIRITIALAFLITSLSFAQQGINYKALIKDGGGNIVASQSITIQFQILQGGGMTNVYQETHTPTTDANGIVIINIGEGTTSDVFADIDWGADDHYLNVQINTGSGLTDMATTQFMAVPYALNATNVEDAAFKSSNGLIKNINLSDDFLVGSTQLNDDGNINHDSRLFFDKTLGAFRVGRVEDLQWDNSNLGSNSFASGFNNTASGTSSFAIGSSTTASGDYAMAMGRGSEASGLYSTAMGFNTTASGNVSIAMGWGTTASGLYSTAMGLFSTASGNASTAIGKNTTAPSFAETVVGQYNTPYTLDTNGATQWKSADRLFVIGNGTASNARSNAFTILKNGNVGIGTSTPNEKLHSIATGESEKAIYGEATGLYGKGIHVKVTSTHSSANAILAESGGGSSYAGYFVGKVHVAGVLSKSSGSFKIDHPLDPENKYLSHSFVESPDMMNIYNGNIVTDKSGNAIVILPDYFEALNMEFRYQLTVIGEFAQAIISKKIEGNTFKIKTDKPNIEVSWQVTGVRNDAFARKNRIKVEEEKEVENIGTYLNPEAFSKNSSKENTKGIN